MPAVASRSQSRPSVANKRQFYIGAEPNGHSAHMLAPAKRVFSWRLILRAYLVIAACVIVLRMNGYFPDLWAGPIGPIELATVATSPQQFLYLYSDPGSDPATFATLFPDAARSAAVPPFEAHNDPLSISDAESSDVNFAPPPLDYTRFTLVVQTYKREQLLLEFLRLYVTAPSLDRFIVVWNNVHEWPPPMSLRSFASDHPGKVLFFRSRKNSLNNRYLPFLEIRTKMVLELDDDVRIPPADIEYAFLSWSTTMLKRDLLMGFMARGYTVDKSGSLHYVRNTVKNSYCLIISCAALYPRDFHAWYTWGLPQAARDLVDEHFNGEDILFNFMYANKTGSPPLLVEGSMIMKQVGGISTTPSHVSTRSKLLTSFIDRIWLGYNPLKWSPIMLLRYPPPTGSPFSTAKHNDIKFIP